MVGKYFMKIYFQVQEEVIFIIILFFIFLAISFLEILWILGVFYSHSKPIILL